MQESRKYLSVKDIAEELGIARSTAYDLIRRMPYVRIGKLYRVSTVAFRDWLHRQEKKSR